MNNHFQYYNKSHQKQVLKFLCLMQKECKTFTISYLVTPHDFAKLCIFERKDVQIILVCMRVSDYQKSFHELRHCGLKNPQST